MLGNDPFQRRTATPSALVPWIVELAKVLPGLAESYGIGSGLGPSGRLSGRRRLDPRTRERVIMAVTEVNGCRYCAWIHGAWRDFLGDGAGDAEEALLAYARACAEAGRPIDPTPLADLLPPESLRAVRATVAQIEVSNLVGNTVDELRARLARKRPPAPVSAAREAITVALAVPLAAPLLATAGVMRLVNLVAPPLPEVEAPKASEANLLAHLLAAAVPAYLSNALVRLLILDLPVTVSVGVRAGRSAATVSFGRGRVAVANGITSDALVVVEGEIEPLLRLATGSMVRDITSVRIRPNQ
ncbi:MAG: carboxymuconolactone decarboxylase family protein [Actinomycetota bacterium]